MKFIIDRNKLFKGISKVQGLTSRKTTFAITNSIFMEAKDEKVSIYATDLETAFEGHYPSKIENDGCVVIPSRKFFEIIKDFPQGNIIIEDDENRWIKISSDNPEINAQFHLVGMDTDEFPEISRFDNISFFQIKSSSLKEMIEKSLITGITDENRVHLSGIFLELLKENDDCLIKILSTDSHRLLNIKSTFENPDNLPFTDGVIISKKGIYELLKLLDSGEIAKLFYDEKNFIISVDNETFIIRLLKGDFPDFDKIFPKTDKEVKINKNQFLNVLKRMSILSSERYNGVKFLFKQNNLIITATNPEIGDSKEEISIEYNKKEELIAFNPKYLIDSLNVIKNEYVLLKFINKANPCVLEPEDNKNFISVIMPMRIENDDEDQDQDDDENEGNEDNEKNENDNW